MKYLISIAFLPLLLTFTKTPANPKVADEVQWMSWQEATEANEIKKKKLLVDVYTEWCGWCKVMDKETFSDSAVIQYINEHFYAIKLDAEQKEPILWNGQEFKWIPTGKNGVHTLAYALCDGKMSYPSLVFLNEKYERIRVSKGFKDTTTLLDELKFAAEEAYLNNAANQGITPGAFFERP